MKVLKLVERVFEILAHSLDAPAAAVCGRRRLDILCEEAFKGGEESLAFLVGRLGRDLELHERD